MIPERDSEDEHPQAIEDKGGQSSTRSKTKSVTDEVEINEVHVEEESAEEICCNKKIALISFGCLFMFLGIFALTNLVAWKKDESSIVSRDKEA